MLRLTPLIILLWCTLAFQDSVATKEKCFSKAPLVTTPLGQMKGSILTSRLGKRIYSFRGIRYAEAPVGDLRFKPPVPAPKWEGVYNATEDAPLCPQPHSDPTSEDCLFLNVYSTKLPKGTENPKRPVIFHILPGGFYSSGSASYWAGPNYLMDQEIVLVTFNYRLGSLGFLSTGTKEAPGNNGLKDQVVALKWVQQNIAAFGGDPDSVTLTGYSAGSWSIDLHLVSPMTEGLFHKAIAMSGSSLGSWPLPRSQLDVAKKQARFVGCPEDTAANIVKCLKTVSASDLGNSLPKFQEFGYDPILIWSPVIEEDFGQERFLSQDPLELIQKGKFKQVPFMTGLTSDEFGFKALSVIDNETLTKELNDNWEEIAPITFIYERGTEKSKAVSKALRKFYLNDRPVSKAELVPLAQLYTDSIEGFPVHRTAEVLAQYSNESVYYYHFSFLGRYSHFYLPGSNNTPYGVIHHDDLMYLFYIQRLFPLFNDTSSREAKMVDKLTRIQANFARTGNPTPHPEPVLENVTWKPFTTKDEKYMEIGERLVLCEKLNEKRYAEWDRLYPLGQ